MKELFSNQTNKLESKNRSRIPRRAFPSKVLILLAFTASILLGASAKAQRTLDPEKFAAKLVAVVEQVKTTLDGKDGAEVAVCQKHYAASELTAKALSKGREVIQNFSTSYDDYLELFCYYANEEIIESLQNLALTTKSERVHADATLVLVGALSWKENRFQSRAIEAAQKVILAPIPQGLSRFDESLFIASRSGLYEALAKQDEARAKAIKKEASSEQTKRAIQLFESRDIRF